MCFQSNHRRISTSKSNVITATTSAPQGSTKEDNSATSSAAQQPDPAEAPRLADRRVDVDFSLDEHSGDLPLLGFVAHRRRPNPPCRRVLPAGRPGPRPCCLRAGPGAARPSPIGRRCRSDSVRAPGGGWLRPRRGGAGGIGPGPTPPRPSRNRRRPRRPPGRPASASFGPRSVAMNQAYSLNIAGRRPESSIARSNDSWASASRSVRQAASARSRWACSSSGARSTARRASS